MKILTAEHIKKHFEDQHKQFIAAGMDALAGDAALTAKTIGDLIEEAADEDKGELDLIQKVIDNKIDDRDTRKLFDGEYDRRKFGRAAMQITEDRYSAGSTAAEVTIAIAGRFGVQAAINFAEDLSHHES